MKCGGKALLLFIVSCMVSGCVIKTQLSGVLFCDVANPIYVSNEDLMTEETERQIWTHNTIWWASVCANGAAKKPTKAPVVSGVLGMVRLQLVCD